MKLATYRFDNAEHAAVLEQSQLWPLEDARSILDLLGCSSAQLRARARGAPVALESVELLAPIPAPRRNVFCVGWNYLAHFEEGQGNRPAVELPQHPTFFTKATTSVCGPYQDLPLHSLHTQTLDWEAELALIIGTGGCDISEADALSHVFGYTAANDVSARDLQRAHGGQWFKGKSLDCTCPLGPWVATADELQPFALGIECRVNGVSMQHASTRQMIFSVARLIAELSAGLTLLPGDIILTGTPEGIGGSRQPPLFLKAGDVLETEIEGIGVLRNRIIT